MLKTISLMALSLFVVGCGSVNKTTIQKKPAVKPTIHKVIKTTPIDNTPKWILNPNKANYVCSIGSAKLTSINEAKKIANIKAKANISKNISIYINSENIAKINCTSKECKKEFNKFSEQQSTNMLTNISVLDEYIDEKNNRYYQRVCTSKSNNKFIFSQPTKRKYETTKTSCIQQSLYQNKTLDEQKKILIENAKFEALGELYGHLLYSKTDIKNGKITDDSIKQRAVGNVRIKGNPSFYNGSNLGEICSNITAYVTKEDLAKFKPKKINLKRFCYNKPNTQMQKIKEKANYSAYKEAISLYKPSLKNISDKQSAQLIHGFEKSNENFDFDTGVYCFDAKITILPYELELSKTTKINLADELDTNLINGLKATFYKNNDYDMKYPIYTTYVDTLTLAYKKLPVNDILEENTPYKIKFSGFIKSDSAREVELKLYEEVYEASLFINGKKILSRHKKQNSVKLKKGYNPIKFIIKTANRYDVKIKGDIEDIYTIKSK